MASTQMTVEYRPLRIGFVVEWDDLDTLVRVAGMSSLIWGGSRNPVLALGPGRDQARELVDLYGVDVLSAPKDSPEAAAFLAASPYLSTSLHQAERLFVEDWHSKKQNLTVLDCLHLIEYYWRTEFRDGSRDVPSPFALVDWHESDRQLRLLALSFGYFPTSPDLLYDFRKAFEKGLAAEKVVLPENAEIPRVLAEALTPLRLTELRLEEYRRSSYEPGVFVGDSTNFEDLVSFWNLRAAGLGLAFLPLDAIDRFGPFVQAHVSWVGSRPKRFSGDPGRIGVYTQKATLDDAQDAIKAITAKGAFTFTQCSRAIWNGRNIVPSRYLFSRQSVLASIDRSFQRYAVSFAFPPKPVDKEESDRNVGQQHLVAVVDPLTEFAYPDHSLKTPYVRGLDEFLSRAITFDPWKLKVDRDGLALIIKLYESTENLYPVSTQNLVEKLFDLAGIRARRSSAGLIAHRLMRGMKEDDPLEACRVFKIRGVRKLLKEMRAGDTASWDDIVATIGRAQFDQFKQLYIEARSTPHLTPQDVLEYLLKKRILCPKLRLRPRLLRTKHDLRCAACGLRSSVHMKVFEGTWVCPFCDEPQALAHLVGKEFKKDRSGWRFRKCGFFGRDNNQEGALPVALALLQLKRVLDRASFLYSTALLLGLGRLNCETDFVVFHHGHGECELGIGECKDEGGVISAIDVRNLEQIGERFTEIHGIRTVLVFAKTADGFRPDELSLFRELVARHKAPVLMTNQELEPYDFHTIPRPEGLPVAYPFTLEEMARNSAHIYLR